MKEQKSLILGQLPDFGKGIETKLVDSHLLARGWELEFATAKVPVRRMLPLMRAGQDGSLIQVGEKEMVTEQETRILAGVARNEQRSDSAKMEEKVVTENGQTYILFTQTPGRENELRVVRMFKRTELLQMDREAMVRLHIIENKTLSSGLRTTSLSQVEAVLEVRSMSDPEHPHFSYVEGMLKKEGGRIEDFRIEIEEPFQ